MYEVKTGVRGQFNGPLGERGGKGGGGNLLHTVTFLVFSINLHFDLSLELSRCGCKTVLMSCPNIVIMQKYELLSLNYHYYPLLCRELSRTVSQLSFMTRNVSK